MRGNQGTKDITILRLDLNVNDAVDSLGKGLRSAGAGGIDMGLGDCHASSVTELSYRPACLPVSHSFCSYPSFNCRY